MISSGLRDDVDGVGAAIRPVDDRRVHADVVTEFGVTREHDGGNIHDVIVVPFQADGLTCAAGIGLDAGGVDGGRVDESPVVADAVLELGELGLGVLAG